SACPAGFQVVGEIAHPMEACMTAVLEGRIPLTDELLHVLAQGVVLIRILMQRDRSTADGMQRHAPEVLSLLNGLRDRQVPVPPADFLPEPSSNQELATGRESLEMETAQSSILPDEYFLPQLDQEVLSYFVPEALEYLEALEANLLQLDAHPQNKDLIQQLFRTAHTLKGSAYTVGFQVIGDLIHHVEDFMGAVRDQRLHILPGHTDSILRALDVVRVLMQNDPNTVQAAKKQFQASLMELKRLELGDTPGVSETSRSAGTRVLRTEPQAGLGEEPATGNKHPEGKSGEEREVIRVSRARLEQLMNLVGELVIGRGRLEQRLWDLERLSEQVVACKTRLVDAVQSFAGKHTTSFREAPSVQATPSTHRSCGFDGFGTLDLGAYDDFNLLARRIGEVSADITESMAQLSGSIRHAHDDMKQLQHVTRNIRDEIARTRMIPIGTPFTRFRRAIRDLARASNKEVAVVTSGEHTQVDTGVVERLVDPLVHLVRNAVYHGIELPADRVAKGKLEVGTIYLHAAHRGNSIMVEVEDDGAGLNLEKIREKVVTAGLAQPEQVRKMPDAEVLQFIFAPGFSTADSIGDQAGRGVGLDVVKQVVEGMNGHIEVESLPDVGTKFTLHLPLTLLITTALLVRAGAERYAIALSSIREVTLAADASLTKAEDRTLLSLGEEMIEVQSLRHLLRGESADIGSTVPIVIVRTAAGVMGLAVDELIGRHEIVIKSLGGLRPLEQSCFGGATIDPQGCVILVIDPSRLGSKMAGQPSARGTDLATMSQTGTSGTTELAKAVEASHGKKVCIH
ncbi:MAG TPA: chemotaxis protein CheA, partial [Nitrospira sp.]|nr:chemotaxis protein CheA [Nitrospira sp.]